MFIQKINETDTELLGIFLSKINKSKKSFRYFNSRDSTVLRNHLLTILGFDENGSVVGYAHLDQEEDVIWLGICICDGYHNLGYGSELMKYLVSFLDRNLTSCKLTVDVDNIAALRLYEKFGFQIEYTNDSYHLMTRKN